jgi:glyceraldehyde-3-phosphate dehydrogenase type I
MSRVAVVGFGRIGRSAVKAGLSSKLFTPSVIADIVPADVMAPLFEVDTNYGRWPDPVHAESDGLVIGGTTIAWHDARNGSPDWLALGVDLVLDCTGRATTRAGAQAHLDAGAGRVLVSAPSKTLDDCDAVLLPGINLDSYDPARHKIVSMASCTTNGLAPVVKVLRDTVGIKDGFFTTVHAYTNTQSLTDQPMKDRRGEHHPVVLRRGQGARLHLAGPQGHRQGLPGACADREHRGAHCASPAGDDARRAQRGVRCCCGGRAAEWHPRRAARGLGVLADRRRHALVDR